ncbi:hypothetical protein GobsT_54360 [Gemmata obscuriglobus]|nr:hypothetical protein GobsT_54360 [Gemmata obscuriglobus]VTS09957.1 unnamed protein product [Gemmata obscuriglobus UQM 2246]
MLRVDKRIVLFWLAAAAVGLAPGCGRTQDVGLVEGRVTQGGRGAPGIAVMFIPVAQGAQPAARSTGITDEDGRYTLASDDGRAGVAAGTYRVCLVDTRALSRPTVALPAAVIKHLGPPKMDPSKTQATSSRGTRVQRPGADTDPAGRSQAGSSSVRFRRARPGEAGTAEVIRQRGSRWIRPTPPVTRTPPRFGGRVTGTTMIKVAVPPRDELTTAARKIRIEAYGPAVIARESWYSACLSFAPPK